jgi:hypothetical protein
MIGSHDDDRRLRHQEFNSALLAAIDESISELLGQRVLESLYSVLERRYDVTRDELPYRLDTAYMLLGEVFGIHATRTISKSIIRRLYGKLNLEFEDVAGLGLMEEVEMAKKKLAQGQSGLSEGR